MDVLDQISAEYPQIAEHISEAIDAVYSGSKQPKQALDDAAAKICQGFRLVR